MPYKIVRDNEKFCVEKVGGKRMGCHDDEGAAKRQMAAIMANEDEMKDVGELLVHRLLRSVKEYLTASHTVRDVPAGGASHTGVTDTDADNSPEAEKKEMGNLTLLKASDGTYRWLATYSNSFIDKDSEIITADSHRKFVRKVESGQAPLPSLWLHHEEGWRFGKAAFVGVDEIDDSTVMAIAGGTVDKDKAWLAEAMMKSGAEFKLSHGMPIHTIRRNKDNPLLIEAHETAEITVLLAGKEANDLTGFILSKENDMVNPNKRAAYADALGIDEANLLELEKANGLVASTAKASGRLHKDKGTQMKDEEVVKEETVEKEEVAVEATAETEVEAEVKEDGTTPEPSAEIAALQAQMTELKEAVLETFAKLGEQLKADKEAIATLEKEMAQKAAMTPQASLAEQFASAIGSPETRVDGRTSLAKDGPVETEAPVPNSTGIQFLDQLRKNSVKKAGRSAAVQQSVAQMAYIQGLNGGTN